MSRQVVKVISGWSNPGGSTIHHIALTNLLNESGYDCTFYGPHDWHLRRCRADRLGNARVNPTDFVITHFIRTQQMTCRLHVLSCHETDLFELRSMPLAHYDWIQFVSEFQRRWHGVGHRSIVIPPVVERVRWTDPANGIAGVVGSIDENKQTHVSIERALADGYQKVLLFGVVTDAQYYQRHVERYVAQRRAVLVGHEDDRSRMYGQIQAVYHHSRRETFGLVEAECFVSGIPFVGPRNNPEILERHEVLGRWQQVLQ